MSFSFKFGSAGDYREYVTTIHKFNELHMLVGEGEKGV